MSGSTLSPALFDRCGISQKAPSHFSLNVWKCALAMVHTLTSAMDKGFLFPLRYGLCFCHCSLSACIGSIEAARCAGRNPAMAALIASAPTAARYDAGLLLLIP